MSKIRFKNLQNFRIDRSQSLSVGVLTTNYKELNINFSLIMKLTSKILIGTVSGLLATTAIGLLISYSVLKNQGQNLAREKMRAMTLQAESVRDSIGDLSKRDSFDYEKLVVEFNEAADFRDTGLYNTIPIVAAWKSIEKVANADGMEFRVPKVRPRNRKNQPTAEELEILDYLKSTNSEDYFEVDDEAGLMVYARPIRLDESCLTCHGDPANSPTGDGKDIAGFEMENWKAGEIHGAFILKNSLDGINEAVASSLWKTVMWGTPATAIIVGVLFVMIRRTIVGPINKVICEISESTGLTRTAAEEVSGASAALARGASEQAASLEETSATLEEIGSMTNENAGHADKATKISEEANSAAEEGNKGMEKMLHAMSQIQESSGQISDIIKTIDEIAFQTNILALNAAVEAARAGEAGAGFAVVADEVRSLAQRSADAARETAEKIEDSVQKSEDGVSVTHEVNTSLNEISERVQALNSIIVDVKNSSSEQSEGIGQINATVAGMDKITQESSASTDELAATAAQASSQAKDLENAVRKLRSIVDGSGTGSSEKAVSSATAPTENAFEGLPNRSGSESDFSVAKSDSNWN